MKKFETAIAYALGFALLVTLMATIFGWVPNGPRDNTNEIEVWKMQDQVLCFAHSSRTGFSCVQVRP